MKKRKLYGSPLIGYVLFFLLVAAIITVAVLVFDAVENRFGENKKIISLLMLVVVATLAAACTAFSIARQQVTVARHVARILDATDKIAAGDFSVRLALPHPYYRANEYDCIMDNLNKMAEELSHNEMLKSDFISGVSHELKTPLAVIQNYATLLQNDSLPAAQRRESAQALANAAKRLTDLVGNILKLNRLEHQKITEPPTVVRLDELIAQTVLGYEDAIDRKGLQLDCDLDEVQTATYPAYLEIVCNNLISNAVKFTEEGGTVRVTLKRKPDGKIAITVSDTGCGISAEAGAHIFDKFYQADTSHASEGNGLGLALVKRAIDTIGGEIAVESAPGKGSTFTVTVSEAEA